MGKTVTNYPTGSPVDEWNKVGGTTAWEVTDDDGVTNDYIYVLGFSGGKITELTLPPIPAGLDRLTRVKILIDIQAIASPSTPGLRVDYYIGGEWIGHKTAAFSSASYAWFIFGDYTSLNKSRTDLVGLTRKLKFTPLDGGGFPPVDPET